MNLFRVAIQSAALACVGLPAVTAMRKGAAVNETVIEDLDELEPPFKAYTGIDYGPGQKPPPLTKVVNMTGIFVETPLECAVRCNDEELCNAASFYGDNPVGSWPGGLTCWLKTLGVPCELPADYEVAQFPDTIFLLAQEEECDEDVGILLASADAPDEGPLMAPEDYEPLMAPMDYDRMLAPLEEGPMMGPSEGAFGAPLPAADPPAAAPGAGAADAPAVDPPAAPTTSQGDLISDFEVDSLPDVAVEAPPAQPAEPAARPRTAVPEPAPGPEDSDFPDPLAPLGAFAVNRETDGGAGLSAVACTVAAAAAAVYMAA